MSSSKQAPPRNLAVPFRSQKAKKLLEGLANLQDGPAGLKWFQRNFPEVLAGVTPIVTKHSAASEDPGESTPYYSHASDDDEKYKYWLLPLRGTLRAIWRAPDTRTKQWGMFRILQDFFLQGRRGLIHSPVENPWDDLLELRPNPTDDLLMEFLGWADLTRFCENPDCAAPYFIAVKRSQKCCSADCSVVAQREFKRAWWAKHGRQWRLNRGNRRK